MAKFYVVHGSVQVKVGEKIETFGLGDEVELTEAQVKQMDPVGDVLVSEKEWAAIKSQAEAHAKAQEALAKLGNTKPPTQKQLAALAAAEAKKKGHEHPEKKVVEPEHHHKTEKTEHHGKAVHK